MPYAADDLPSLPADFSILDQLKRRIDLAKQVDQAQHKLQKEAHDDKWLRETAEAMDIELEDDQEYKYVHLAQCADIMRWLTRASLAARTAMRLVPLRKRSGRKRLIKHVPSGSSSTSSSGNH